MMKGKFLFSVLFTTCFLIADAQVCDTALWSPNGPVQSVYLRDSILYVGGNFSQVSPVVGHFVALDSATAAIHPPFPMIRGTVYCMTKDSLGRIYVGGNFRQVGNLPISNLFRLDTNGTVDLSFQPDPDGYVTALYIYGHDLYVGGDFLNIGGSGRERGASFNVTDTAVNLVDTSYTFIPAMDTLTDFNPQAGGVIYTYAMNTPFYIIAGGDFLSIGGAGIHYLSYLSSITGHTASHLQLPWSVGVDGIVRSVAVKSGTVYAAGDFNSVGGYPRKGFAVVNIAAASLDLGYADALLNGYVNDVKIVNDRVYLGGRFTVACGYFRNHVACFSLTIALLPWAPNISSEVICVQPWKDLLCIGGKFTLAGADSAFHAALLDTVTGNAHAWNPMFDGDVRAMIPGFANEIYCGGDFSGAGGVIRNNLFAVNVNTRRPTTWAPLVNASVNLITANSNALFIAGSFNGVNTSTRNRLASFDLATGNLNAFDPGVNGIVRTIDAGDSLIYIGGNFSMVANQSRENIACIDLANASATNWDPGVQGTVNRIIVDHEHVYVGGFYSHLGGIARDNLGRVDLLTAATDPNWICNTNDGVYDMDLYNGKLLLGGWFVNVMGSPRQFFAATDTITGALFPDDPGFDSFIRCFTRYSTDLFISGPFDIAGSNSYPLLCDFDNVMNDFDQWTPAPNAFPQSMAASRDWLFIGGSFTTAGYHYHPNLAMVSVNYVTSTPEFVATKDFVHVYPNPTSGLFCIDAGELKSDVASCEIHDLEGRLVSEVSILRMSNSIFMADLSGSPAGSYILTLKCEDGKCYHEKIIKQ